MIGRRKPLNMIEGPQYPDIKKGPPRFVKSKRIAKVDVGAVGMDAEKYPELWGFQVLTNSKDDITQRYGRRPHHTIVVDREFRPPYEPLEDIQPISRGRRPVTFGRINPGGGYFKAQNISSNQVDGFLKEDERVKPGALAPTYESPITFFEPTRQPVLAKKLPSRSAKAGKGVRRRDNLNPPMHITLTESMIPVAKHAGFEYPFGAGTPFEVADIELHRKRPELSIDAGTGTLQIFTPHELPIYEYVMPYVDQETRAGEAAQALMFEIEDRSLKATGLKGKAFGGANAGFESEYRDYELDYRTNERRSKLNQTQRTSSGRRAASELAEQSGPARARGHQARRLPPTTGFYQVPAKASGTYSFDDKIAQDFRKSKVGVECVGGKSGLGNLTSYYKPLNQGPSYHFK